MEEFNNICVMEYRDNGRWCPVVCKRYNYTKTEQLREFGTLQAAVDFAKNEIKNHFDVKLCVSYKYLGRPETIGLTAF